ncbi:SPOR domain-containing protein [Pleomorphovibrio marinus]|uniref:SPOR domain-containing protein n=1 Tax=Pleomorphovibrio marinus TaxID=2164132 RepID=UPI000E0A9B87|nr:SPOR domain-containing protein [Pleomorphovibrio marinus]
MKPKLNNLFIFTLLVFLMIPFISQAQLSKEEKKKWKRERRALSPEELKQMVEEKEKLASMEDSLRDANSRLERKLEQQEKSTGTLRDRLSQLEKENQSLSQKVKANDGQIDEATTNQEKDRWNEGVAFRVQIGAIEEKDAQSFAQGSPNLDITMEDGFLKYLVGYFRDYEEADKLKKELRKLGLKGAWVVPFKDGNRVPLKEVLSTLD